MKVLQNKKTCTITPPSKELPRYWLLEVPVHSLVVMRRWPGKPHFFTFYYIVVFSFYFIVCFCFQEIFNLWGGTKRFSTLQIEIVSVFTATHVIQWVEFSFISLKVFFISLNKNLSQCWCLSDESFPHCIFHFQLEISDMRYLLQKLPLLILFSVYNIWYTSSFDYDLFSST